MVVTIATLRPVDGGIARVTASVRNGQWACDNPEFLNVLQTIQLAPGYYPDRDLALAHRVIELYGGEITDARTRKHPPAGVTW